MELQLPAPHVANRFSSHYSTSGAIYFNGSPDNPMISRELPKSIPGSDSNRIFYNTDAFSRFNNPAFIATRDKAGADFINPVLGAVPIDFPRREAP